jgi:hypothetical protein
MIQPALKCGFKDCELVAIEGLEIDLPDVKFLSQLCQSHVMFLLRSRESDIGLMVEKGQIEGVRK